MTSNIHRNGSESKVRGGIDSHFSRRELGSQWKTEIKQSDFLKLSAIDKEGDALGKREALSLCSILSTDWDPLNKVDLLDDLVVLLALTFSSSMLSLNLI